MVIVEAPAIEQWYWENHKQIHQFSSLRASTDCEIG
jgi:hypothetical protein